jgi:hypothetical protein
VKPVELFSRDVHTFWATTFQLDLKLFDQFLLRRLGNEPLNAVVLCDEDDLSETLGQLTEVDRHVAANANRRYLLRGIRVPSGGRFHPKTYFFASRRQTVLLVGSGNLTRSGLDRGAETFATFDASIEHDKPVIRAWASWVGELVDARGDAALRARYQHLRATVPGLVGSTDQAIFFTNGTRAFVDVLDSLRPANVTELHVSAPFFDERAEALRGLIERVKPTERVRVYLGARPSVDGKALASMLSSTGVPATVYRFVPDRFVHAKLVGIVGPDGGLLACGSANLSHAALDRVYEQPGSRGNCEAIVVRQGEADDVRATFCPPDSTLTEIDLSEVTDFRYEPDDAPTWPTRLRILSAVFDPERRIVLHTEGALNADMRLMIDDDLDPIALEGHPDGALSEVLPDGADPLVVWIVDAAGTVISNAVVIDDPQALQDVLGERSAVRDRPGELADEDERSDLVALLSWAHRQFIFDLDDTPAIQRARHSAEAEAADSAGFWERYAREELSYDQRSQTYRPLAPGGSSSSSDLLLREIEAMLRAAPHERRLRLVRGSAIEPPESTGAGHPWSLSARQQLRARNVIRRWARALPDPRHAWLAPEAPARNYEALIEMLALIWLGDALDNERIVELLGEVWEGLLGSETRKGFVDRAEPELRAEVLDSVQVDVRELAAGMAFISLVTPGWKAFIYDWQTFLVRGIESGIFVAGELSRALVDAVIDTTPLATEIEDLLLERAEYVDDEEWGKRIAKELGLASVRLLKSAGFKNVSLVVDVIGMTDPAHDSRTVELARRAMSLKQSDHVMVQAEGERFLLRLGAVARARVGNETHVSIEPIEKARLDAVAEQGGTLADLLGIAAA